MATGPAALPDDPTLDELRLALAPAVADAAVFDGWSEAAVRAAAAAEGADPDVAALAYPGGPIDMIAAWIESVDLAMIAALPAERLAQMKIRERIAGLVLARLDAMRGREEALRRALSVMAMPQNAARALQLGWRTADVMWRCAGDTATDYNHYTKRTMLGAIYGATLTVFVDDESEDKSETRAFLDRRIDGIMRFEKAKAQLLGGGRDSFNIARFLGRLRYPAR
ncbi:COQ9 family protein [Pelagerythrobacter marensis]|uniref:COQ9 family protein n=1 Tax=Pelagerythrobacter marensis TaxID=543877 RepID=A0ABZ2D9R6_9SPHN